MLAELLVRDLGVIRELSLVPGPGMTALTGETGAGKTMVVEALELLVGGRAESSMVRAGAAEAVVEGRFLDGEDEVVVKRVVPIEGRSRAYVDGSLATASTLTELGRRLVDLHGQHTHQSLLSSQAQRAALDRYGDVDVGALVDVRQRVRALDAEIEALGGDEHARARELDLLRFQLTELESAGVQPGEDETLATEDETLTDAVAHREAAEAAVERLLGEAGVLDTVGSISAELADRGPFAELDGRLRTLATEIEDLGHELRTAAETIEEDPERLDTVRARRRMLADLHRKYGRTVDDVLAYAEDASRRLADLEEAENRAATIDEERRMAREALGSCEAEVGTARRDAAPRFAEDVRAHLGDLALPDARLEVAVSDGAGDEVEVLLAANPGAALAPLRKVASGGELARIMLALRLVLTAGPPTLVFDEVDAGIGGETALAVGRSLAALASDHQILVVTHLAQVAAFADQQVAVTKAVVEDATVASAELLDEAGRRRELSRMLSGAPESAKAQDHADELLAAAATARRA